MVDRKKPKTKIGVWITLHCEECGVAFRYFRKTNVRKKYCTPCAKIRTARSKKLSEDSRQVMSEDAEKARVELLLSQISDVPNYKRQFQTWINDAL